MILSGLVKLTCFTSPDNIINRLGLITFMGPADYTMGYDPTHGIYTIGGHNQWNACGRIFFCSSPYHQSYILRSVSRNFSRGFGGIHHYYSNNSFSAFSGLI
jgi:hypothetical protein